MNALDEREVLSLEWRFILRRHRHECLPRATARRQEGVRRATARRGAQQRNKHEHGSDLPFPASGMTL